MEEEEEEEEEEEDFFIVLFLLVPPRGCCATRKETSAEKDHSDMVAQLRGSLRTHKKIVSLLSYGTLILCILHTLGRTAGKAFQDHRALPSWRQFVTFFPRFPCAKRRRGRRRKKERVTSINYSRSEGGKVRPNQVRPFYYSTLDKVSQG